MERIQKPNERVATERCPYCHDLLEAAVEGFVTCEGCGTRHHGECLAELGRCTVLGCERPLVVAVATRPEEGSPPETAARRLIRRRLRERARGFMRNHVRPLDVRYRDMLKERDEAREEGDWAAAESLNEELAALRRAIRAARAERPDSAPAKAPPRRRGPSSVRKGASKAELEAARLERCRTERARAKGLILLLSGAAVILGVLIAAVSP